MTQAIKDIKESHTKTKRVKKIKAKKFSDDVSKEEPQEEEMPETTDQPESPKHEPEEPARQDDSKPQHVSDNQKKIVIKKKKPLKVIERTTEEPALGQVKLRKSSVVKREWDNPELQQVSLKQHILEQKPLDEVVRSHFDLALPIKN